MTASKPIKLDQVPIVAERWPGNGPPTVLLHAGVCDRRSWYTTAEDLTRCGPVIVYDRRGFGESPVSTEPFEHVHDLITLLDKVCHDEPARLVGSSMGGQIACEAAVLRADLVRNLVLFAPAISGAPEPTEFDPNTRWFIEMLEVAVATGDVAELNRLETWLWLDGPASPEGRVGGHPRELLRAMNEIILRSNVPDSAGVRDLNTWGHVEDLTVPVDVVWGELDVPVVVEQCEQLVARLPMARAHIFEDRAHLPYLEDPVGVAKLMCAT